MERYSLSIKLLVFNSAILLGCAVFDYEFRDYLLILCLFFLPFVDRSWSIQASQEYSYKRHLRISLFVILVGVFIVNIESFYLLAAIVLFNALPEEWFFRAYFMSTIESFCKSRIKANIITSSMFALMHLPMQGLIGLSTFFPSLFMGWMYQKNRDFMLLVMVHAIFNYIFILFLKERFVY